MKSLYERLREEHYFYCLGKKKRILIATCEYIEGCLGIREFKTEDEIAMKYGITSQILRKRKREICELLGIDLKKEKIKKKIKEICKMLDIKIVEEGKN